ncbi:hypothetical protein FNV43_RR07366 [Rhamnella rubrinervis]|uniref:Uncharacterized protein n=1 Tax=Rhamnella rubrinervis TaxID=2594499 RepID=A0A8K0HF53_9ROSA|nr:hypothetical protein FNV43_RR07366 [Rhamnella rubrinervis]
MIDEVWQPWEEKFTHFIARTFELAVDWDHRARQWVEKILAFKGHNTSICQCIGALIHISSPPPFAGSYKAFSSRIGKEAYLVASEGRNKQLRSHDLEVFNKSVTVGIKTTFVKS